MAAGSIERQESLRISKCRKVPEFLLGILRQVFNLGFEFFHGSKYWVALSRPGINDPLDFRNTRGNVYDIYAIWRLDLNQYLRFAYTHIDYQYANSSVPVGGTYKVNDKANIFSLFYNVRF